MRSRASPRCSADRRSWRFSWCFPSRSDQHRLGQSHSGKETMPLHGKGLLAVFNQVKAGDERDLNEWYNREHIDERVNLPGFHRARRYVAVKGGPKYLATYECDRADDLATRRYLHVLANQTPWSERVIGRFTHFHRMTMRVQLDLAHGEGGALTTA